MKNKSLIVSSEMGTGKTQMAIALAAHKKFVVNFIMAPPHLVSKWADEIRTIYRNGQVKYKIVIVSRWTDLVPYTKRNLRKEGVKYFFIVSRETAKLSYRRKQVYNVRYKYVTKGEALDGAKVEVKQKIAVAVCPCCGKELDESINEYPHFKNIPYKCPVTEKDAEGNDIPGTECGTVLRDVDREQSESMRTRISVAEYIKKQWPKGSIDLLIADEVHEYKGGDTGQGNAFAMMCTRAKRIVGLTGTLLNGYASSLFYILYRLNPSLMKRELNLDYNQVKQFVEIYGAHEEIVEATETNNEGIVTRMGKRIALKEKPKISPYLLSLILDMTIFLRLDEIKMDESMALPLYEEIIDLVDMDKEYENEYADYIGEVAAKIRFDKRFLGNLANDGLSVADLPFSYHSAHHEVFYTPPVIRHESQRENEKQKLLPITAKEKRLLEHVKTELKAGRKCLVYVYFSNKGVGDDIQQLLEKELGGYTVALLKPSIPAKKRQKWIENNPSDVLICNPELVKTGLDLLQFPTIIFYEPTYNVFTLKQASRRSWRIGQRDNVKVIFMAYRNTAQHKALELIGAKVAAANSLEGRLSGDDDLSSMGDDDDNIQLQLAKAILSGEGMSEDIETTRIESLGQREWDPFEEYYLKLLQEYTVPAYEDFDDMAVALDGAFDEYEDAWGIFDEPQLPTSSDDVPISIDLFGEDGPEEDNDEKITIYKRIKVGKGYREQRLEVTRAEIDAMVAEQEETASMQLSLF
ncbi:helicase-related protein [Thiomicrolovo sp. ZZH C-3]